MEEGECQAPVSDASYDLGGLPPSLATATSGVGPTGEVCPPRVATHMTNVAPRLTEGDTHHLLWVLETYRDVPLREVTMAQPPPFFKGRCSSLL